MEGPTHHLPGMKLKDHHFQVPLDHERPNGEQITVFAREVVAPDKDESGLPWLLFLQGGPGFPSPRPAVNSGWLKRALQDYRVLLLDQRGTGRSTPVNHQTLAVHGTPEAQADYLTHFRADSIVRDAEFIREALVGEDTRWSALGQSYGGFCVAHYLSTAPHGLEGALFTGGLPPLVQSPDEVYRATYRRVIAKNERYYERYPDDAERAGEILAYLDANSVRLPGGGTLTPRRFQQLGIAFGASDGFEKIHYLLEDAFVTTGPGGRSRELGYAFLRAFENSFSFETHPIYALMQESIYCQGAASAWAAERVRADFAEFDLLPEQPPFFTGEMIYAWMFDDYEYLRPVKEAAEILAYYDRWPQLYDLDVLRANSVPCAAAVYYDDMYVERAFSEEAASTIGGMNVWVTNEYEHNALRADGDKVLDRLLGMLRGTI